ncbi:MAG TPA: 16S rRNA (guanine(527)-N(7))-methyltransferase RsmG [Dehalococcoidia bacterium]|nr:16S rRNA (guanine(527)-N(7))-methyltransferase RsmG [Dehalococcoidia bacterium]
MPPSQPVDVSTVKLNLDADQVRQLTAYRDLLASSALKFNLTSLRDPEQIERRHIIESIAFGELLNRHDLLDGRPRVIDIGTGAGLPGIPLKIAWPDIELVLLESVGKKCRFLEEAVRSLGFGGVEVVEGRAEEAGHEPRYRESFDLVIARAVAPLPVLLEYSLPLLRVGGHLAATKGSAAISEIDASEAALGMLGGRLIDNAPFNPPGGMRQTVVVVEKIAPTPDAYPRRSGMPSKRPIQ